MKWRLGFRKDIGEKQGLFGLENFGNTCYCNSVIQVLYFYKPFRERLLSTSPTPETLNLFCSLHNLFQQISRQRKRTGWISPQEFITCLRLQNETFRGTRQQDAHEFFNYLINNLSEHLAKHSKHPNWVRNLFQGMLSNTTKCSSCSTVTTQKEPFIDLSIEISPNISLLAALARFSKTEVLDHGNKFYCDECQEYCQAEKQLKILEAPQMLVIHLKRFKYTDTAQSFLKLHHRIPFTTELCISDVLESCDPVSNTRYSLHGAIVHLGTRPSQGHYIAIVKMGNGWACFDDNTVEMVDETYLYSVFGANIPGQSIMGTVSPVSRTAYILFYQIVNTNR